MLLFLTLVKSLPRASTISLACAQPQVLTTTTHGSRHRQRASEAWWDTSDVSDKLTVGHKGLQKARGRHCQKSIRMIASTSYRQQDCRLRVARSIPHQDQDRKMVKTWHRYTVELAMKAVGMSAIHIHSEGNSRYPRDLYRSDHTEIRCSSASIASISSIIPSQVLYVVQ